MQTRKRAWIAWLAVVGVVVLVGCPSQDPLKDVDGTNTTEPTDIAEVPPKPAVEEVPRVIDEVPNETPPPTEIPEVHLTEAEKATCRIQTGDTMPDAELVDTSGESQTLAGLLGERLTVVLFWARGENLYSQMAATDALQILQSDIAEAKADQGVSLVAINVGDTTEVIDEHVTEAKSTYPVLADTDSTFFAEVATENLPRVYLLDSSRKVLWFDLEFSQTTRRSLLDALEVALAE